MLKIVIFPDPFLQKKIQSVVGQIVQYGNTCMCSKFQIMKAVSWQIAKVKTIWNSTTHVTSYKKFSDFFFLIRTFIVLIHSNMDMVHIQRALVTLYSGIFHVLKPILHTMVEFYHQMWCLFIFTCVPIRIHC